MKVALLGTGKTGSKILELLDSQDVTSFDSQHPPTAENLTGHDVAISFLPGPALLEYLDVVLAAGLPLASGSTGFDWPADIDNRLRAAGLAWITAGNFSLGMNLIHGMIRVLAKAPQLFDDYQFHLYEVHHIHKKDQPSGTALTWQQWLGQDVEINSDRIGETIGDHSLTLSAPYEDITITHHAKDRKIFAEGALWAARKLTTGTVPPGLHQFQAIMEQELLL